MPDVVERLIDTFVSLREEGERFIDTVVRVGPRSLQRTRLRRSCAGAQTPRRGDRMNRVPVLTHDGAWIADDWSVVSDPAVIVNEAMRRYCR